MLDTDIIKIVKRNDIIILYLFGITTSIFLLKLYDCISEYL